MGFSKWDKSKVKEAFREADGSSQTGRGRTKVVALRSYIDVLCAGKVKVRFSRLVVVAGAHQPQIRPGGSDC